MAKTAYPTGTTHKPAQTLDIMLANGLKVRGELIMVPNGAQTQVAHVDLKVTDAGQIMLHPVAHNGQPRSIIDAVTIVWQKAQHEANRLNTTTASAAIQGEEFAEVADVVAVSGNTVPVTKF